MVYVAMTSSVNRAKALALLLWHRVAGAQVFGTAEAEVVTLAVLTAVCQTRLELASELCAHFRSMSVSGEPDWICELT